MPGNVVLAIWARETDYGRQQDGLDAIRVLATQAYVGKRKDFFRNEFLYALKLLQDGVPRADLRSSWGGAMGLTQFLPSEFYKYAVDFDGDGKSRHLAFGAGCARLRRQAAQGQRLAQRASPGRIEVRVPATVDCTLAEPSHTLPIGEWLKRGYVPAYNRKLKAADLAVPASLLLPEGTYGPGFLTPKNYYVIKEYNYSDLYVLFVGHLADLIARGKALRACLEQERAAQDRAGGDDAGKAHRARALQRQDRRQGRHAHARGARRLSEEERAEGRLLADRGGAREYAALKKQTPGGAGRRDVSNWALGYSQISTRR